MWAPRLGDRGEGCAWWVTRLCLVCWILCWLGAPLFLPLGNLVASRRLFYTRAAQIRRNGVLPGKHACPVAQPLRGGFAPFGRHSKGNRTSRCDPIAFVLSRHGYNRRKGFFVHLRNPCFRFLPSSAQLRLRRYRRCACILLTKADSLARTTICSHLPYRTTLPELSEYDTSRDLQPTELDVAAVS